VSKYLPFGAKVLKINPVNSKIILLKGIIKIKRTESSASKEYSQLGRHAVQA